MLRICVLLSFSLVAIAGCKSSGVIKLRERTAQKYEPSIPEAAVAAWNTPESNDSCDKTVVVVRRASSVPKFP